VTVTVSVTVTVTVTVSVTVSVTVTVLLLALVLAHFDPFAELRLLTTQIRTLCIFFVRICCV
jgi:hypothetical protein